MMTLRRVAGSRSLNALMLVIVAMGIISFAPGRRVIADSHPLMVKITIETVTALDDVEGPGCGQADFYAKSWIDGEYLGESATVEDDDDIQPDWEFSKIVDSTVGSITARLEVWEDDWFGICLGDDQMDISPDTTDMGIDLVIDLEPCMVGADLPAGSFDPTCAAVIQSEGTGDDATRVTFRVNVDEPPSAENMRVSCLHNGIWPQPGDDVTIDGASFDADGNVLHADEFEIWVDGAMVRSFPNRNTMTYQFVASGSEFSYACRIIEDGVAVWSGWHRVTVGPSTEPDAVPVLLTGPRHSRIDVVYVADTDDFGAPDNGNFLRNVRGSIKNFYALDPFLKNQDMFNFWIATGTGNAESAEDGCDHSAPDIPWADTRAILHFPAGEFRDCAPRGERIFSADVTDLTIAVHEAGHSPFGLADEYPGDGGYFQTDEYPNLYHEMGPYQFFHKVYTGCVQDAPNLGRTEADCREINEEIDYWFDEDWYLSDPQLDFMAAKSDDSVALLANASDIRRIEWVLSHCRAGNC